MKCISFKPIAFLFLFILSFQAYAQESLLYKQIQKKKTEDVNFKSVSSAFALAKIDKSTLSKFKTPDGVSVLEYNKSAIKDLGDAITLSIPLRNKELKLELLEVSASFYNYEVVTEKGESFPANKNIKHYRGVVKDDARSIAAITFYENEIMGVVATDEGNFNLSFDKQINKHLFYNDKNLKQTTDFTCGTRDLDQEFYEPEVLSQQAKSSINSVTKCVYLYFETEYDIYQAKGSLSNVEAFITGIYNQVALLYQNEDIETQISKIVVWTTNDPYTATSTQALLTQFQNYRTSFKGDLGQLLTFRFSGGGIAEGGYDGLCNPVIKNRMAVSTIDYNYQPFPVYSWNVNVITHEFGHLLGSYHTQACKWNGNNTAIDGCAEPEEGSCARPGIPPEGGTIMSYCHTKSVGVNFNNGFGLQPGNVIRNKVANANCLCSNVYTISGSAVVCSSYSGSFTVNNLFQGDQVTWTCEPYLLQRTSTQGLNPGAFKAIGSGDAWVQATVQTGCGQFTTPKFYCSAGAPSLMYLSGPNYVSGGSSTTYCAVKNTNNFNANYYWSLSPTGYVPSSTTSSCISFVFPSTPGNYNMSVSACNSCGCSTQQNLTINVIGYRLMLSPNPSATETTVSIATAAEEATDTKMAWSLEVYDQGNKLKTEGTRIAGKEYKLNTTGWKEGTYIVRASYKGEVLTGKLVVGK